MDVDILNLTKSPLIYTMVFHISLQFGAIFGEAKPNKATLWLWDCLGVFGWGFIFRLRVLSLRLGLKL